MGNMRNAFSQIKELKKIQKKISAIRGEAETGGGTVKAICDGEGNLIDLEIDSSVLEADEIKVLPKLIKKAITQAQKAAKSESQELMKSMTAGMNFPGM